MIFSVISSVLIIISIVCLFGLTPEQVTDDLMRLITPNDTMRDKSRNLRGNKKKHRLYRTLLCQIKEMRFFGGQFNVSRLHLTPTYSLQNS